MTYYDLSDMKPGDSVVLLVTTQNAYPNPEPVTVSRVVTHDENGAESLAYTYASDDSLTVFHDTESRHGCPGHEGMNRHVQRVTGAPYATQYETVNARLTRIYCALRRKVSSGTVMGRDVTASDCLSRARYILSDGRVDYPGRYMTARVWSGLGGSDGATSDDSMRWIENPAARGLRIRAAHDVVRLDHTGWYLDSYGMGDTVHGIVAILPGRNGKARAVAGYADPFNDGPVCIDVSEIFESDPDTYHCDAYRDASRRGDSIAERYAEQEREYHDAYDDGARARDAASDATACARRYVETVRAFRDTWRARHTVGRRVVAMALDCMREACEDMRDARDKAREMRDGRGTCDAWKEGYFNGV